MSENFLKSVDSRKNREIKDLVGKSGHWPFWTENRYVPRESVQTVALMYATQLKYYCRTEGCSLKARILSSIDVQNNFVDETDMPL